MTKLKTIEERAESVFTVANLMAQPRHLVKEAITNDRQAIREVLREEIEGEKMVYNVTDTKTHRRGKEAYNRGITKALALVDELLGGEVTE